MYEINTKQEHSETDTDVFRGVYRP